MKEDKTNIENLVGKWIEGELSPEQEKEMRSHPDFEYFDSLLNKFSQFESPPMDLESSYAKLKEKKSNMAINESERLADQLKIEEIQVKNVVVNQIMPENLDCRFCRVRSNGQKDNLEYIKNLFNNYIK